MTPMGNSLSKLIFSFLFLAVKPVSARVLPTIDLVISSEVSAINTEIRDHLEAAFEVLSACAIAPGAVQAQRVPNLGKNGNIVLFEPESPYSPLTVYKKLYLQNPIKIFVVKSFSDKPYSAGLSFAEWIDVEPTATEAQLANTVWIAYDALKEMIEKDHIQYSTFAHELAHVLTREAQHNGKIPDNLLSIYSRRTNFILPEQCQEIRNNSLLR